VILEPQEGSGSGAGTAPSYQLTRWSKTNSGGGAGMSSQWGWAACSHSGEPHVGIWRHQGHVEMPESRRSRATARGRVLTLASL
jgi:hypothetical protein